MGLRVGLLPPPAVYLKRAGLWPPPAVYLKISLLGSRLYGLSE